MNEGVSDLLIIGIIALLLGIGIGLAVSRLFFRGPPQNRRVAQQMDELQHEYTRYQAKVNEHFMETAHRMRRLNDAQREMHEHLAQGANRLSSDTEWQEAMGRPDLKLGHQGATPDGLEPPRDYAPKSGPKEKGTLAEDFGFDANRNPEEEKPAAEKERR